MYIVLLIKHMICRRFYPNRGPNVKSVGLDCIIEKEEIAHKMIALLLVVLSLHVE